MDLEEREGGTHKERGERGKKKGLSKNIPSGVDGVEGGQYRQKQREECLEGKLWPQFLFKFSSNDCSNIEIDNSKRLFTSPF